MEQPISAILIVNTVANTAGAAVAGAPEAQQVRGGRLCRALSLGVHAQQHRAVHAEHDALGLG